MAGWLLTCADDIDADGPGSATTGFASSSTLVYDTFTDADSTLIQTGPHTPNVGGAWTERDGNDTFITSNRARGAGNTHRFYNAATPSSADYDVEATVYIISTGASFYAGPMARFHATNLDFYRVRYDGSDSTWKLEKVVGNGAPSSLGTFAESLSAGDSRTARLSCNGTTIKMIINGVEKASVTDSDISAANKAAWVIVNGSDTTGFALDTFWAGTVGGTVGP